MSSLADSGTNRVCNGSVPSNTCFASAWCLSGARRGASPRHCMSDCPTALAVVKGRERERDPSAQIDGRGRELVPHVERALTKRNARERADLVRKPSPKPREKVASRRRHPTARPFAPK
ncbi:hypothetical protein CEXT_297211 [Caerostris extrusa]|uniref:Uncharacterized protein n=1 Tax=Caerostris extrusa TaxID=172846 RepID=A0AAV4MEN5_CAEEX|nr:hypothetical protein CEXT_297211 [Caerostris extrusa]